MKLHIVLIDVYRLLAMRNRNGWIASAQSMAGKIYVRFNQCRLHLQQQSKNCRRRINMAALGQCTRLRKQGVDVIHCSPSVFHVAALVFS